HSYRIQEACSNSKENSLERTFYEFTRRTTSGPRILRRNFSPGHSSGEVRHPMAQRATLTGNHVLSHYLLTNQLLC
ncbi:MAG: hypothetical protein WCI76_03625, partial [bacterium]